jgi:N-acetylmuramoyl-L-alanine amidase
MKSALQPIIVALVIGISVLSFSLNAIAFQFDQTEVDQDRFVAIAVPRAFGHTLVIVEQVSDRRPCWSESGSQPTIVDPLLLNFDFTGICGRATDSNGYSVRMAGTDLVLSHALSVQSTPSDILLVAQSRADVYAPPIIIGRTYGFTSGFAKIILEPGWRLTKRVYQGKTLGHIYFTSDSPASYTR